MPSHKSQITCNIVAVKRRTIPIMNRVHILFNAVRLKQWVKNTFLFIPSFFAGHLLYDEELINLTLAFFAFSLITSSVYIFNDIRDVEQDRLHPVKKNRPFAAKEIPINIGIFLGILLLGSGIFLAFSLSLNFLYLSLVYVGINLCYSLGLKNVPIVDLIIVSFGFIIRIYLGGIISNVPVSHWLSLLIFLLSLFIILAKRRDDVILFEEKQQQVRKSTAKYNSTFINSCITMVSGITIVCYIMYTVSPEIEAQWDSEYIFGTTVFVIAGIMRYLQLTMVEQKTGSPTQILYTDKFIIITLISWLSCFATLLYL